MISKFDVYDDHVRTYCMPFVDCETSYCSLLKSCSEGNESGSWIFTNSVRSIVGCQLHDINRWAGHPKSDGEEDTFFKYPSLYVNCISYNCNNRYTV